MDEFEIEEGNELLMHTYETLPKELRKFWRRRYELFSRYDDGIYLTSELWFSVTPEDIAVFTAKLFKQLLPDSTSVLDICCGGGGNTIHFARYFKNVGAVDIKQINIDCTIHNASLYGVEKDIWTHTGDWTKMVEDSSNGWIPENLRKSQLDETFDFVFCSPPWGGVGYSKTDMDLNKMEPLQFDKLVVSILKYTKNLGLFLPKSSRLDDIRNITRRLGLHKTRVIYVGSGGYVKGAIVLIGRDMDKEVDYNEITEE